MTTRQRIALASASAVLAIGWLICTILGAFLAYWPPIPSGFVRLFLPETVPFSIAATTTVGVLAVAVAALACAVVFASFWMLLSRRSTLGFAAGWLSAVLACFVTVLLWSVGAAIGSWPPVRVAWLFGDVQQSLLGAGMVGIIWGWIPALTAVLITRLGRSAMPALHGEQPESKQPESEQAESGQPAGKQAAGGRWLLAASAIAASILLIGVVPLASAPQSDAAAAGTPAPTPTPVVYGSPLVGPTTQGADPKWCTSEQVSASTGGGDAATGHRMLRIVLSNVSDEQCTLNGYPDLAFDDEDSWAMGIFVVHGGSFMTTDAGAQPIALAPGASARAAIGWNAQAAAGGLHAATVLVAPYSGQERAPLAADLDIVASGTVSVTAWELVPPQED